MKVSIVIPVYNEEKTVGILLDRVWKAKIPGVKKEIIIVESNSSDKSRGIVKRFVKNKRGVRLILENKPEGKGTAVRRGFKEASGDIILIQDADLEYDVRDYEKLIRPIIEGKTLFVLGSRHLDFNGGNKWKIRNFKGKERLYASFMNWGGILLHTLFNILYGTKLTDPTTMYKVFHKKLLEEVNFVGKYFELDFEIVAKFVRLGYIPLEIPIKYKSRGNSEGKKVKLSRDVLKWLMTIIKFRFIPISAI